MNCVKKWGLFFLFGLFIIIYNPPVFFINFMHFVGLISILSLLFKDGNKFIIRFDTKKNVFKLYCIFIFVFFYLIIQVSLNNSSYTVIAFPIYFIIDIIPFALLMKRHMIEKKLSTDDLVDLLYVISLIQSIIAIVCYIIPSFHRLIIKLYLAYGYDSTYAADARYRNFGYAGGLTFSTAIFQTVISILLFMDYKKKGVRYILYSLFILFSAFINARTSLIAFAVGIVVAFFSSKISINKKIKKICITLIVLMLCNFIILPFFYRSESETFLWILKGYREIMGFLSNDNMSDSYFVYVTNRNKWPIPPTLMGKIFGKGHMTMGGMTKYGISSDVGYINDLWLGGILYMIVVYIMFYTMMMKLYKKSNITISSCGLILIIIMPIMNIKGPIFGMNDITNLIVILFICSDRKAISNEGVAL